MLRCNVVRLAKNRVNRGTVDFSIPAHPSRILVNSSVTILKFRFSVSFMYYNFIALIHPVQWTIANPVGVDRPTKRQKSRLI